MFLWLPTAIRNRQGIGGKKAGKAERIMYRGSVVIKDFLAYQGVDPWSVDWQAAQRIYLREMQKGLFQRSGSLAMLPSYLHVPDRLPTDVPVLVIDAGGTNLRLARAVFGREG